MSKVKSKENVGARQTEDENTAKSTAQSAGYWSEGWEIILCLQTEGWLLFTVEAEILVFLPLLIDIH